MYKLFVCTKCSYVEIVLMYIRLGHEHMLLMLLSLRHCPPIVPQVSN
jgi:hypothetical protein